MPSWSEGPVPATKPPATTVPAATAAAAAAAAAVNNLSPGSRPLSNHVPRSCTKPFPNNPHSDNSRCKESLKDKHEDAR